MKLTERIKLQVVLAQMSQAVDGDQLRYFSIKYVKLDGTVGEKPRVRRAVSSASATQDRDNSSSSHDLKKKGIIRFIEEGAERPFSVKRALLTHFNGMIIWH